MYRRSVRRLYLNTRNQHLAPEHESWHAKHEPWVHLRRMGKLAGTGFYIPPAWYQHFRMFPPVTKNFNEAETENPQNAAEPTQMAKEKLHEDSESRAALRLELAKRSRSAASAGNRYLNQFWVRKPIDDMEREYYRLTRSERYGHEAALKKVLQDYHEKQAVQRRVHAIQAEEAKLTGKFITMREALSVLNVFQAVSTQGLATHQYAELAENIKDNFVNDPMATASVATRRVPREVPAAPTTTEAGDAPTAAADGATDAGAAGASSVVAAATPTPPVVEYDEVEEVVISETPGDTLPKLRRDMLDGMSDDDVSEAAFWYDGFSPEVAEQSASPSSSAAAAVDAKTSAGKSSSSSSKKKN